MAYNTVLNPEQIRAMQTHSKILIIDDERLIATTLAEILKTEGYEIATAFNGEDAVRIARRFRPDFLLSDIAMPGLNGVQAVLQIREFLPDAHVLFISGHARSSEVLQEAQAKGYEFELALKPLNPRDLLDKVRTSLQSSATPVILNVDDDEANRYAVSRYLSRAGFGVKEASTGEEALRLAKQQPDLILLDIGLPDLSGFEVGKLLQSSPETSRIPIVYLTNTYKDEAARTKALELGAKAFMTHPVEPDSLCSLIRELAAKRKASSVGAQHE